MAQLVLNSQMPQGRKPMTVPVPKGGGAPLSFGPGVPRRIEQLVNAFARWVGYPPVAVDGVIDANDAAAVVAIERWLGERRGDPTAAGRLEAELAECGSLAEIQEGRDGIERSAEQVWLARHQQAVVQKLPAIFAQMSTQRGATGAVDLGDLALDDPATWAIGVVAILGVGKLLGIGPFRKRKGRR